MRENKTYASLYLGGRPDNCGYMHMLEPTVYFFLSDFSGT
jgi:hypothetical protein